jgi:hypothetical protein
VITDSFEDHRHSAPLPLLSDLHQPLAEIAVHAEHKVNCDGDSDDELDGDGAGDGDDAKQLPPLRKNPALHVEHTVRLPEAQTEQPATGHDEFEQEQYTDELEQVKNFPELHESHEEVVQVAQDVATEPQLMGMQD